MMGSLWEMVMKMAGSKAGEFGKQASSFGDKVANPSQAVQQYGQQQMQQPQQQQDGGKKWGKWATPQDTSAGLVAGQPNDPMYGQMMQQVMQNQQPQQAQRQPMTPATMPQMPGAIAPQNNFASLIQRLLGGR
jgi:hypothetical protein